MKLVLLRKVCDVSLTVCLASTSVMSFSGFAIASEPPELKKVSPVVRNKAAAPKKSAANPKSKSGSVYDPKTKMWTHRYVAPKIPGCTVADSNLLRDPLAKNNVNKESKLLALNGAEDCTTDVIAALEYLYKGPDILMNVFEKNDKLGLNINETFREISSQVREFATYGGTHVIGHKPQFLCFSSEAIETIRSSKYFSDKGNVINLFAKQYPDVLSASRILIGLGQDVSETTVEHLNERLNKDGTSSISALNLSAVGGNEEKIKEHAKSVEKLNKIPTKQLDALERAIFTKGYAVAKKTGAFEKGCYDSIKETFFKPIQELLNTQPKVGAYTQMHVHSGERFENSEILNILTPEQQKAFEERIAKELRRKKGVVHPYADK